MTPGNPEILSPPILVFGGPYSNLQATRAIREVSESLGIAPKNVICTGDVVAYCGQPEQTVNEIRNWGCHVVMGNCEESIGYGKDDCGCGFEQGTVCAVLAADWFEFAMGDVSDYNKQWMRNLPRNLAFNFGETRFSVIHGGVEDISEFIFDSTDANLKRSHCTSLGSDCVIAGHSGIPFGQMLADCGQKQFWLNAGVIGMPANDGTTNGWYMLLELNGAELVASWYPLEFDFRSTMAAMRANGLPDAYRRTLKTGLWPSMSVLPDQERAHRGCRLQPQPLQITFRPV